MGRDEDDGGERKRQEITLNMQVSWVQPPPESKVPRVVEKRDTPQAQPPPDAPEPSKDYSTPRPKS